ncbi:MAG: hypothetical protein ACXWRE_01905 [Pseudobdellovibrionaceae bacterium]
MKKALLMVLTFAGGCNYNHIRGDATTHQQPLEENSLSSLDYQSLQIEVLGPQCLRCHSSAGGSKGGLNLETYEQVRLNMNKIYFRSIEKKDMPPDPLSAAQFELLKNWLEAGVPEKNTGKAELPIKGAVTWTVIKNRVLSSSCLDCHSGKNPDANLDFESLEVVRKNIMEIFNSALVRQTMPLQPYTALSESQKQALMKWISQGMPE